MSCEFYKVYYAKFGFQPVAMAARTKVQKRTQVDDLIIVDDDEREIFMTKIIPSTHLNSKHFFSIN